jgi:hypothetical protein
VQRGYGELGETIEAPVPIPPGLRGALEEWPLYQAGSPYTWRPRSEGEEVSTARIRGVRNGVMEASTNAYTPSTDSTVPSGWPPRVLNSRDRSAWRCEESVVRRSNLSRRLQGRHRRAPSGRLSHGQGHQELTPRLPRRCARAGDQRGRCGARTPRSCAGRSNAAWSCARGGRRGCSRPL